MMSMLVKNLQDQSIIYFLSVTSDKRLKCIIKSAFGGKISLFSRSSLNFINRLLGSV